MVVGGACFGVDTLPKTFPYSMNVGPVRELWRLSVREHGDLHDQ